MIDKKTQDDRDAFLGAVDAINGSLMIIHNQALEANAQAEVGEVVSMQESLIRIIQSRQARHREEMEADK